MNSEHRNELEMQDITNDINQKSLETECDDIGKIIKSGIYKIINKINGKSYYGQSKNIEKRFREHKHCLRHNIHINPHLQRAWNKYGENSFIFEIHCYCPILQLNDEEQKCLDLIKKSPKLYYNIGYDATSVRRGLKHTEKTKLKMRKSKLGNKNPNFGNHYSIERIKNMSDVRKGPKNYKYDYTIYTFIHPIYGIEKTTRSELINKYKLNKGHLGSVINGLRNTTNGWKINI